MFTKRKNQRAQAWISDYTISLLLFLLVAVLCVKIITNSFSTNTDFYELKQDSSKISEMLLSEGYPADWTNDSVVRLGLLTSKRLDPDKVFNAMNMSYASLKSKLQTGHDFLVVFEDRNNDLLEFDSLCAVGSSNITINSTLIPVFDCHNVLFTGSGYDNLVKVTRLVIYNSSIIKMEVYVWD